MQKVTLTNLKQGAALEIWQREFDKVLENMADRNTKVKTAREITLTVKIVPTEDRCLGAVSIECKSKLAAVRAVEASLELVQEGVKQVAYQRGSQGELPLDVKPGIAVAK
jgi:predicted HTH domain antitoxin